jgi:hypothetical protein
LQDLMAEWERSRVAPPLFIDDHFAHGNLRDWAAFTATARSSCAGPPAGIGSTRGSRAVERRLKDSGLAPPTRQWCRYGHAC